MIEAISSNKDLLDILGQLLVVAIPAVLTGMLRTYVKNSAIQNKVAAITRFSNAAIDYVENLDQRGDLSLPPDIKKGGAKLKLAAEWLETELHKNGIRMDNEQAQKWVSAEFQKRVENIQPETAIAGLAHRAVDLIEGLENLDGLIQNSERMRFLVELAADWLLAQLAGQRSAQVSRDQAISWIRGEILQRSQVKALPSGDRLVDIARQAVSFMNGLKTNGQLEPQPGNGHSATEVDIAVAWTLTEAAKLGLFIPPTEIAQVVATALRESRRVTV